MKTIFGSANNIKSSILGVVTKKSKLFRKNYIYVTDSQKVSSPWGYKGIICTNSTYCKKPRITISNPDDLTKLNNGDVVTLKPDGKISILWDTLSIDNSLMMTEECNCNCIMCPQPPQKDEIDFFKLNQRILAMLPKNQAKEICLTGGEPTLSKDKFIKTLMAIKTRFSDSNIHVLTNGKNFSDFEFVKKVAKIGLTNLTFCVSIHSDTSQIHDKIVRTPKSFEKTILGIQNLAIFRQKIELRYVINKINYSRMLPFSEYVYKNFPFVIHIAFMAQEIAGYAKKNFSEIWIDPVEYKNELYTAVKLLHQRALNVSIYNVPLCLMSKKAWPFARQSISTWKNIYLDQCDNCFEKQKCCGVFSTSSIQSRNINPFPKHG